MHPCVFMIDPESPLWTACMAKYVSLEALEEVANILGFEGLQGLRRYLAENVWYARETARVLLDVYKRRYGKRAEAMLGRAFVCSEWRGEKPSASLRAGSALPAVRRADRGRRRESGALHIAGLE
ncbi:MAG: hypothetical protein QXP31_05885 [Pyrobaculum sp.]